MLALTILNSTSEGEKPYMKKPALVNASAVVRIVETIQLCLCAWLGMGMEMRWVRVCVFVRGEGGRKRGVLFFFFGWGGWWVGGHACNV